MAIQGLPVMDAAAIACSKADEALVMGVLAVNLSIFSCWVGIIAGLVFGLKAFSVAKEAARMLRKDERLDGTAKIVAARAMAGLALVFVACSAYVMLPSMGSR
jgi:L-cystine uptake protein TcyP (sodium:dicarboxylate symporter family)